MCVRQVSAISPRATTWKKLNPFWSPIGFIKLKHALTGSVSLLTADVFFFQISPILEEFIVQGLGEKRFEDCGNLGVWALNINFFKFIVGWWA